MAVVAHRAALMKPTPDGSTQREHWAHAAKRGNRDAAARLEGPPFPESLAYLDDWFSELQSSRRVGMAGLEPVTYTDIDAWARLTGADPTPYEVRALLALDAVFRNGLRDDPPSPPKEDAPPMIRPAWPVKRGGRDA